MRTGGARAGEHPPPSASGARPPDAFFLPQLDAGELHALDWTTRSFGGLSLRVPVATPALIEVLCDRLLEAQALHLADRPVAEIAGVLGRAVARWYDPEYPLRRLAGGWIPEATG